MNQKQLFNLLFVGIVLGGLGLVVYERNTSSWEGAGKQAGNKVLGDFPLNDVAKVNIKTNAGAVTLTKKNETWVVADRGDYPADYSKIGNLIQGFWDLKSVQNPTVGPSQFGRLELVAPAKGATNTGTLVELLDKDSKPVASILLGKKQNKKAEGGMPGMEGYAIGRFVMPTTGANASKVSLVSDTLDQAAPKAEDWLDKAFVHVDKIESVAVSGSVPEVHWTMSRVTDEATEWKLADLNASEKVDTSKVPSFTGMLGSPFWSDVLPADAKIGDKPQTVTVTTFEGLTYTFKLGKPQGDNYPVSVSLTAAPAKERKPGKDEKPADKKRLDDEFAAKLKTLNEKVAKEKAFESRIFLVSKSTFDSLLKKRSELLEEKKASPTPAPASAAAKTPASAKIQAPPAKPGVPTSARPVHPINPPPAKQAPVVIPVPVKPTAAATPALLTPAGTPAPKPANLIEVKPVATPMPKAVATPTPAKTPVSVTTPPLTVPSAAAPTANPAPAHTPVTVVTAPVSVTVSTPTATPVAPVAKPTPAAAATPVKSGS